MEINAVIKYIKCRLRMHSIILSEIIVLVQTKFYALVSFGFFFVV